MGIMGKLKVILVRAGKDKDSGHHHDEKLFRRPGRIDRSIENGKEYRTISYDETRPIDDLLPDPAKKQETSVISKNLDYVLILNFGTPVPKTQ